MTSFSILFISKQQALYEGAYCFGIVEAPLMQRSEIHSSAANITTRRGTEYCTETVVNQLVKRTLLASLDEPCAVIVTVLEIYSSSSIFCPSSSWRLSTLGLMSALRYF
jgi:hypothetical protein